MPLRVSVVNGDLSFISEPLLLGHYRALRLTGTEDVMNRLVGRSMQRSLAAGVYPDEPGDHQIFMNTQVDPDNPWRLPRPQAVIVVGLGAEGKLRPVSLAMTVRQAVIAWTERRADEERLGIRTPEGPTRLAATLIGSGGSGISAAQSAQFIAQGVREANELIDQAVQAGKDERGRPLNWTRVEELALIELYLDRATEAWRGLRMQAAADKGRYDVSDTVTPGQGSLRRPPNSGYRGANYDFISAIADEGAEKDANISYALDTKRARTEIRGQAAQAPLLRRLVSGAADADNTDAQIGRTLFKLLVPVEMEPFFAGTTAMVIELNSGTAGIPWELLDSGRRSQNEEPWAIRCQLLRKLRTEDFTSNVPDADADASILIIGEPACKTDDYPRLPGAAKEARAVCKALTQAGVGKDKLTALISPEDTDGPGADARTILNALMERDWRVVHISGHGEPPEKIGPEPRNAGDPPQRDGEPRGVVLSDDTFLGPREVKSMRVVPELVFLNCCFLAARNTGQLLTGDGLRRTPEPNRPKFAATVAEALIGHGVRCVIAAGWAVDDEPASVFATSFYDALLDGKRFIEAVSVARRAAFKADSASNTWAAYQCYGDPDWMLRRGAQDPQQPDQDIGEQFEDVASALALKTALETIAVKSKFQKADADAQRRLVTWLETKFGGTWGDQGDVAEAFGQAWSEIGDRAKALGWYRDALEAPDGTASLKAMEQIGNLQSRLAWETVNAARKERDRIVKRTGRKKKAARTKAEQALLQTVAQGRKDIGAAMRLFDQLIELEPTLERESLYGSAFKRLAMLEGAAGRPADERKAIEGMALHYGKAEKIARTGKPGDLFYPAMNRMAALVAGAQPKHGSPGFDASLVTAVRESANAKAKTDPDFWCISAQTEVSVYEALAAGHLADRLVSIQLAYKDLHDRVSAPRMWASVYDTASFVLEKYAAQAAGREQSAARGLLEYLETLARSTVAGPRRAASRRPTVVPPSEGDTGVSRAATMKRASLKTARAFVERVTIPAPRRTRGIRRGATVTAAAFETGKNQAAVVGSDIISFVQGVTPERRQAIVNSSLLAQLAASSKVGDPTRVYEWYDAYFNVLTNIGWVVQDRNFAVYHEDAKNLDAHKAILSVATALLGAAPAALALVKTTLEALQSMNADSPWITIFDRESQHAETARFSISLAEQDTNGQFFVTLMAFGLEAKSSVTQVLFFRTRSSEATLRHYSGKVTINTDVLDSVRQAIASKLAGHAADFVQKLPDFDRAGTQTRHAWRRPGVAAHARSSSDVMEGRASAFARGYGGPP